MDFPVCIADPWGFPMLWVQEVDAFVHALPVTKAQFDAAAARGDLRQGGWGKALELNRGVSLAALDADNYWGAFISGVTPAQASAFAECCGPAFRVPAAVEWKKVYTLVSQSRFDHVDGSLAAISGTRARGLLERLDGVARDLALSHLGESPTLADRMFFRLGVMEWVRLAPAREPFDAKDFAGLGAPAPALWPALFDPLLDVPVRPHDPGTAHRAFGFRLFRAREEEATWSQQ